jgi:hypothetical protein
LRTLACVVEGVNSSLVRSKNGGWLFCTFSFGSHAPRFRRFRLGDS